MEEFPPLDVYFFHFAQLNMYREAIVDFPEDFLYYIFEKVQNKKEEKDGNME